MIVLDAVTVLTRCIYCCVDYYDTAQDKEGSSYTKETCKPHGREVRC